MSTVTHDAPNAPELLARPAARLATGLAFAVASALTFALSGPLASALFETGWSAGSVALIRMALGALVALPFGAMALRGSSPAGRRLSVLRRNALTVLAYGLLAVSGAQFCYFMAVQQMEVGPALLIEYTAPAAVVVWFWLRHGHRPAPLTLLGAVLAALGLVLVLDLVSGADLSLAGVAWSLCAMVGAATYFVINADGDNGLPPATLAAGGLLVGALALALLGLVGLIPMTAGSGDVVLAGEPVVWWLPLLALGVVTAGVAYLTGIAAGRLLGARLSSFVALMEVVAGVGFAWLLVDQLPRPVQLVGGLLILAGLVAVKLGEERTAAPVPVEA